MGKSNIYNFWLLLCFEASRLSDRRVANHLAKGEVNPKDYEENRIPTIRREMFEAGLPAPVFQNRRNEFVVILYNDQMIEESDIQGENKNSDLLSFCNIPRSRKEITEYLGISTVFYAMRHYVQPLLKSGDLIMTMPDKPKSRNQKFISSKSK